jgi:hypothetical protein
MCFCGSSQCDRNIGAYVLWHQHRFEFKNKKNKNLELVLIPRQMCRSEAPRRLRRTRNKERTEKQQGKEKTKEHYILLFFDKQIIPIALMM